MADEMKIKAWVGQPAAEQCSFAWKTQSKKKKE